MRVRRFIEPMQTKTAVVTGASGGIGSELCKSLAASGTTLVLVDRDIEKARSFAADLSRLYPAIVPDVFGVDLASHADIKRVTSEILQRHSAIDLLFNNAGVLTETLQFSRAGNELHFEVNTLAPLALIDYLRPALRNAKGGTIVNTSAGLALQVKQLDWSDLVKPPEFKKLFGPYAKSKEALNVITAALAPELIADNIIIRAADPGPTKSRLTKGAGIPLWMRVFYGLLPGADKSAKKIVDAASRTTWGDKTGIFISGQKVKSLPPALTEASFQQYFLQKCRQRAEIQT